MTKNGPRDTGSVIASRYVLTDKGEAAVAVIRQAQPDPIKTDANNKEKP